MIKPMFGWLIIVLCVALAAAVFVSNPDMPQDELLARYWPLFLLIGIGLFAGGTLTLSRK